MDTSGFWNLATGVFIALLVIMVLIIFLRLFITCNSGRTKVDQ